MATSRTITVETFTYNDANEQLTHAKNGVTTTMTYDDWGRLEERDDGTHTASYGYRYGSKLYSVTSDFPGEGNVTYEYEGDEKRRSRVAGAEEAWLNYTVGFDVISAEGDADGSSGALTISNVVLAPTTQVSVALGDLAGITPASGMARYYAFDHLGSTHSVWNAAKTQLGSFGFEPYGGEFARSGVPLSSLAGAYTGKAWDSKLGLFHFPYRQYSPEMSRWTLRDPLGMADGPNSYSYVLDNPVSGYDELGLQGFRFGPAWLCMGLCRIALAIPPTPTPVGGVTVGARVCAAALGFTTCTTFCAALLNETPWQPSPMCPGSPCPMPGQY